MSMTYTWEVTGLKRKTDGSDQLIVQTYWKLTGTDQDNRSGSFAGATPFERDPEAANFIAFDDLTEADVLGWIQAVVVDDYREHCNSIIQGQIDDLAIEDVQTMPWTTASDEE